MTVRIQAPPLMTCKEVAVIYRINTATVNRWAKTGKLHPIMLPSGHRRYLRAELEAIANGQLLTDGQLKQALRQALRGGI